MKNPSSWSMPTTSISGNNLSSLPGRAWLHAGKGFEMEAKKVFTKQEITYKAAFAFGMALCDRKVYKAIVTKMRDEDEDLTEQECYNYLNEEELQGDYLPWDREE